MSKILIVDDEKSLRFTLSEFLLRDGYDVDTAENGMDALRQMESNSYDLLITDIIMSGMSGMDLLQKVRSFSQSLQIIVMTGEPTVETAVEAVRLGANDYLTKPINKHSLLNAVRNAMQIKHLEDEKRLLEEQNLEYQRNLEAVVEKRTHALQGAMQGIIYLLSSVVEIKDPYTAGHQRRVGNLAAAIAGKLGYDDRMANNLRVIGYIHDIGKIVIPTEFLSKPGKLSSLEMEVIRTHAQRGYEMISRAELPNIIGKVILQHHEKCDGSGYPGGLTSEMISDEAKIVMVADVVEGMASHRPYRPALGIEKALEEIKGNAGRLYDAKVVKACVDLFVNDHYELDDVEYRISINL